MDKARVWALAKAIMDETESESPNVENIDEYASFILDEIHVADEPPPDKV